MDGSKESSPESPEHWCWCEWYPDGVPDRDAKEAEQDGKHEPTTTREMGMIVVVVRAHEMTTHTQPTRHATERSLFRPRPDPIAKT